MENKNIKIKFISLLILTLFLSSCAFGPRPDNTKPMYGEVPLDYRHIRYIEANNRFIDDAIKFHGNRNNAAEYYLQVAWAFFSRKDLNVAMMRFNQVWLLNPEIPDVYFGFAALLEVRGNKTEAERFYKIAFEKDTNNERAKKCLYHIMDIKGYIGNFEGVLKTVSRFKEHFPNDATMYVKLGYWQSEYEQLDAAIVSYTRAIEIDPTSANAYVNRGYAFFQTNNYDNAKADYLKAIELDPKYIFAYSNKGNLELTLNNYEEAKKDFEKCVELEPKAGELRRYLGIAKQKLNDTIGACEDFRLAKELGDKEAEKLLKEHCK